MDRVLVPVGEPCPFACTYCYTRGGEIRSARIGVKDIIHQLVTFAQENNFQTIQLGYDGDPFARPERGLALLRELVALGKDINFSTKASLHDNELHALKEIKAALSSHGSILSAIVSLSCWESADFLEPNTPTPVERIATLTKLMSIEIPTFIAVRPILPNVSDEEYERVVSEGALARCPGFILGPLYVDDEGKFARLISDQILEQVPYTQNKIPWSAYPVSWKRYEDVDRLIRIGKMVEHKGCRGFESSATAMTFLRSKNGNAS